MKTRLFVSLLTIASATALAQDEQSSYVATDASSSAAASKDENVLPSKGDWAIAIDANPFLEYTGKLLSDTGATAPDWNFLTQNQAIMGKYFLKDNLAIRGSLRLGVTNTSNAVATADRSLANPPTYPTTILERENSFTATNSNIGLSGGLEWRKGFGRLQGFYGAELGVSIVSASQNFVYGNALTQVPSNADVLNVDVNAADNLNGQNLTQDPYGNPARILRTSSGTSFGMGVRGFIGAEYFILPKLSLGGEFGWGISFFAGGTQTIQLESEDEVNGTEVRGEFKREVKNPSAFAIDSDNVNSVFGPTGRLRITLHF